MRPETVARTRAQCDDCPAIAAAADRSAARNHAVSRGHSVRFVVEQTTTYVGVKKVEPGTHQTTEQRFGQAVRARRLSKGWSQQALSDELRRNGIELHQTGVGRIEAGTRGIGLNEAETIAALLGIQRSEWQS